MGKYKFRLSYLNDGILNRIELEKLECLEDINITEIKELDSFTTKFDSNSDLLDFLKRNNLIPMDVNKLYVTVDEKNNKVVKQKLYSYSEKIFLSKDINKLKKSYIYKLIRDKVRNGYFILKIVNHYQKIFKFKDFSLLSNMSYGIGRSGYYSLTPSEQSEYIEEIEKFMNFVFCKKDGKTNYKNVHDFICFITGETPVVTKNNKFIEKNAELEEIIEEDNVTLDEYKKFNKELSKENDSQEFEPYRDGNDWIAPISDEEIEECLNEYSKKLCFKRDNGEFE